MHTESAMQSAPAPEKVSYWIQRADYKATPDSAPVTLNEALSVLHDHDWEAELSYETELENSDKKKPCWAGVGFVTETGHLLHICPRRDGRAACYFLELDSSRSGSYHRENVARDEQDRLLELLFRGDYASLVQGFDPPVDVSYWIQQADSAYAPDSGPITLTKAQSLLRDYDWKKDLAFQCELETAKKDWCRPTIGFAGAAGFLHVQPDNLGTVECYLWDKERQHCWGCGGLDSEEQSRILDLFYRCDLSLTRDWYEFEMESYTDEQGRQLTRAKPADPSGWLRATWLARIKQTRARRGQLPELTEQERNLTEKDALDLHLREAELANEERRREETIKAARSGRKWFLAIAVGGTLLASLLYSGVLQAWLSETLIKDLWGWAVMMIAGGLVVGGLQHLQLRALQLGTPSARMLSHAANILVGAFMVVAGVITVALLIVFAGTLMLGPGGGFAEKHFFIAVGVVIGIMGTVALLGAYLGYRSYRDGSGHETALEVAGLAVVPFLWVGLGVNFLALIVTVSAVTLQASWIDGNLHLALKIATAGMAFILAVASWLRRKKNSVWARQSLATALLALGLLVAVQVLQTFGASQERPYTGPTIIT
jgi:hypothetical protein